MTLEKDVQVHIAVLKARGFDIIYPDGFIYWEPQSDLWRKADKRTEDFLSRAMKAFDDPRAATLAEDYMAALATTAAELLATGREGLVDTDYLKEARVIFSIDNDRGEYAGDKPGLTDKMIARIRDEELPKLPTKIFERIAFVKKEYDGRTVLLRKPDIKGLENENDYVIADVTGRDEDDIFRLEHFLATNDQQALTLRWLKGLATKESLRKTNGLLGDRAFQKELDDLVGKYEGKEQQGEAVRPEAARQDGKPSRIGRLARIIARSVNLKGYVNAGSYRRFAFGGIGLEQEETPFGYDKEDERKGILVNTQLFADCLQAKLDKVYGNDDRQYLGLLALTSLSLSPDEEKVWSIEDLTDDASKAMVQGLRKRGLADRLHAAYHESGMNGLYDILTFANDRADYDPKKPKKVGEDPDRLEALMIASLVETTLDYGDDAQKRKLVHGKNVLPVLKSYENVLDAMLGEGTANGLRERVGIYKSVF